MIHVVRSARLASEQERRDACSLRCGQLRADLCHTVGVSVPAAAAGGPNHLVSASASPRWVKSPTQATYPSGRINTAAGAVTVPSAGSSHVPTYVASIS